MPCARKEFAYVDIRAIAYDKHIVCLRVVVYHNLNTFPAQVGI